MVGEKHRNLVNIATLFLCIKAWQANAWVWHSQECLCINVYGWAMVQHMHVIILEATKFVIGITYYLSFTCNEVNIIHACGSKLIANTNPFVSWMYGG